MRRAIEGAGAPEVLTDDAVKDLVADAIADVILYTGGLFGNTLAVIDRDTNGAPTEYETSDELSLAEGSIIAAQAALNFFFHEFVDKKVQERIGDEAQQWEYTLSANLMRDQLKLLIDTRNQALETVTASMGALESYTSFLAVRDAHTSQLIEPWVDGVAGAGGQADFRFGTVDPALIGPGFF